MLEIVGQHGLPFLKSTLRDLKKYDRSARVAITLRVMNVVWASHGV